MIVSPSTPKRSWLASWPSVPVAPFRSAQVVRDRRGRRHVIASPRHRRPRPARKPPIHVFASHAKHWPRDMARDAQSPMPGPIALGRNGFPHDGGRASQFVVGRRPHALDHHIAVTEQFGGLLAGAPAATKEAFLTFVFQELEKSAYLRRSSCCRYFRTAGSPWLRPPAPHRKGRSRARQQVQAFPALAGRTA